MRTKVTINSMRVNKNINFLVFSVTEEKFYDKSTSPKKHYEHQNRMENIWEYGR